MNVLLAATHSNSFTTPDTKRTKGQGPGMVNVFLAAIHSHSFTTCGLRGQGPGLVNVLLAATHSHSFTTCGQRGQGAGMVHVLLPPAQRLVHDLGRLRARSQDWWTFFCNQPSKRVRTAKRRS